MSLVLLSCSALNRIAPRGVSFLDQSTLIREKLAELLEKEEEWTKAAQVLAGIDLDSGTESGQDLGAGGLDREQSKYNRTHRARGLGPLAQGLVANDCKQRSIGPE